MSLHQLALEWIANKVNGRITHGRTMRYINKSNGRIPDVICDDGIHEAEIVPFSRKRIEDYIDLQERKVLWLLFERNPLYAFDDINLLCLNVDGTMTQVSMLEVERIVTSYEKSLRAIRESLNKQIAQHAELVKPLKNKARVASNKRCNLQDQLRAVRDENTKLRKLLKEAKKENLHLNRELDSIAILQEFKRKRIYLEYPNGRTVIMKISHRQFLQVQKTLFDNMPLMTED